MELRIAGAQKMMREKKIDAIVVRLSENVVLFSRYWPRNGFSFVLIPQKGEATLICPESDYKDASAGTLERIQTFGWVRVSDGDPYANVQKVFEKLANKCEVPKNSRIGMDIGYDAVSVPVCSGEIGIPGINTQRVVKVAFGAKEIVPINEIVDALRIYKDETDLERINAVNRLGKAATKRFATIVNNPNMREIDVAADIEAYIARTAGTFGMKYAKAWAQVTSGERTADAWFAGMVTGDRFLMNGDLVMLEIGIVADGYWCDLTETVCVGRMDATKAEIYSAVMQAQSDAVMAIRPGVKASDVDTIARNTIARAGFGSHFNHNLGHGVGFAYHESKPIFSPTSADVLVSGMIHSVEPGVYIPGIGGVRLEINVLVCDDGYRILGID